MCSRCCFDCIAFSSPLKASKERPAKAKKVWNGSGHRSCSSAESRGPILSILKGLQMPLPLSLLLFIVDFGGSVQPADAVEASQHFCTADRKCAGAREMPPEGCCAAATASASAVDSSTSSGALPSSSSAAVTQKV